MSESKDKIDDKSRAKPPEDNPSLRSIESNIDKKIGSEGRLLAEKRLAPLRRAQDMSEERENSSSGQNSFSQNGPVPNGSDVGNWMQLGPTLVNNGGTYSPKGTRVKVSGRITAIVSHPSDSNTMFIAAAQGGVWKTTDAGRRWNPTSDNMLSLAIGAIAIDETNPDILYAGYRRGEFWIGLSIWNRYFKNSRFSQNMEIKW